MPAKAAPKRSKSVLKRARQTKALTTRNRSVKNTLKTLAKSVEKEVAAKNADAAKAILRKAIAAVDKAAKNGVIHRNTASRTVSKLTKLVNSLSPSEAA